MRLLLDESLPRGLKHEFLGHEVKTVPEMGWAGRDNGELLELASPGFDVFLTADQGIGYQQNVAGFDIAVITLAGRTNRVADLKPLIPEVLRILGQVRPGEVARVAG